MSANVFIDKLAKPDDQALIRALGKTYPLWTEIEEDVATVHASLPRSGNITVRSPVGPEDAP